MLFFFILVFSNWEIRDLDLFEPLGYRQFAIGDDGSLWVVHSDDLVVIHYDAQGKRVGVMGGKGRGPGEFLSLSAVQVVDEKAYLFDYQSSAISIWTLTGNYERTLKCRQRAWHPIKLKTGFVVMERSIKDQVTRILVTDDELQQTRQLLEWPSPVPDYTGRLELNPTPEHGSFFAVPDGSYAFVVPPDRLEVYRYVPGAVDLESIFEWDVKPIPFDEEWGKQRFALMKEQAFRNVEVVPKFPEFFPPYAWAQYVGTDMIAISTWGTDKVPKKVWFLGVDGREIDSPVGIRLIRQVLGSFQGRYFVQYLDPESEDLVIAQVKASELAEFLAARRIGSGSN